MDSYCHLGFKHFLKIFPSSLQPLPKIFSRSLQPLTFLDISRNIFPLLLTKLSFMYLVYQQHSGSLALIMPGPAQQRSPLSPRRWDTAEASPWSHPAQGGDKVSHSLQFFYFEWITYSGLLLWYTIIFLWNNLLMIIFIFIMMGND